MEDLFQVRSATLCYVENADLLLSVGVEETRYILSRVHGIHGFFGASSMERLPAETAIEQNARMFKNIEIGPR